MLSYLLQGAGLYNSFSNYAFDSLNMKFNSMVDCEMLSNINKAPYITVTDMVAFRLSSSESSNQPEFFEDYKDLWKKYTEKSGVWKSLCDLLADYTGKNDTIVSLKRKLQKIKIRMWMSSIMYFHLFVVEAQKRLFVSSKNREL